MLLLKNPAIVQKAGRACIHLRTSFQLKCPCGATARNAFYHSTYRNQLACIRLGTLSGVSPPGNEKHGAPQTVSRCSAKCFSVIVITVLSLSGLHSPYTTSISSIYVNVSCRFTLARQRRFLRMPGVYPARLPTITHTAPSACLCSYRVIRYV